MTARFAPLTVETAPAAARPLIAASAKQFGFVASPVAKAAHSPALLAYMFAGFGAFDRSSLSAIEREVVAMTVAYENECHYCMALHSAMLAPNPDAAGIVASLRAGKPIDDPKLEALRRFARAVLLDRGRPSAEIWRAFEAAGYGEQSALDVVLGVSVYVMSTVTNILTESELDAPFAAFRWSKRAAAVTTNDAHPTP